MKIFNLIKIKYWKRNKKVMDKIETELANGKVELEFEDKLNHIEVNYFS
jgi:hypothetical protein